MTWLIATHIPNPIKSKTAAASANANSRRGNLLATSVSCTFGGVDEAVDDNDVDAAVEQLNHRVAANVASAARYKHRHGVTV